jgi:hypothetical protein
LDIPARWCAESYRSRNHRLNWGEL